MAGTNWSLGGWGVSSPPRQQTQEVPPDSPRTQQSAAKLEWPLFSTPAISTLQVTGYEIYNSTPFYVIVIGMPGGFKWTVLKSYDEIAYLNKQLVEEFAIDKNWFPQRKMFGSNKKEYLSELQSRLALYFNLLVQKFAVPPPLLLQFLEYKFSDILSITETLSALFYERGDEFLDAKSMVAFSPLQLHCICKRMVLPIISDHRHPKYDFGHLLEFLQHLTKVKVCPPNKQLFPMSSSVDLSFDLSTMKSLNTLVLNSVDLLLIEGLGNIPSQLAILGIHNTLTSLRDILKHNCLGITSDNDYIKWECLRVMDLSYNSLVSIDTSLALCPNLEELNLSHNKIKDIDNLLDLPHLRILDLSHNELSNISELHYRLGNITTLCLANNVLSSLSGLEKCYSVVCLDIQNNMIAKIGEISRLASLPLLEQLMVKGNAFTASPSFRQQVFSLLPRIASQVALDGKPPSKDELNVSASILTVEKGHSKKHKKSSTRKVNIEADIEESYSEDKGTPAVPTAFAGPRRNMEQMRREGGENWLKMLNQQQGSSQDLSPTKPKKKHKHKTKGHHDEVYSPTDSLRSGVPQTPSSGLPSTHFQQLLTSRECNSPWSCTASVLPYIGNFTELSQQEIDHLITNSSGDVCLLEVDIQLGRITEDFAVAGGRGGNRRTRDLTFLEEVRVHEGHNLAIIVKLTALLSHSSWIIYCLRDYPSLADFYVLLQNKMKSISITSAPSPSFLSKQLSSVDDEDNDQGTTRERQSESPLGDDNIPRDNQQITNAEFASNSKEATPTPISDESFKSTTDELESTSIEIERMSLGQSPPIPVALENFIRRSSATMLSLTTTKVDKPGLESTSLRQFFTNNIAKDKTELLMYLMWCGVCLPSTFPYEVQGALMISNSCFYVLEIKNQGDATGSQDSWDSEDLPLQLVISEQLEHLSRVMLIGTFDQSLFIELHDKSPVTSFVLFPPTWELTSQVFEQFKAAMDASSLHYSVMETLEAKKSTGQSGVLFIAPDLYSADRFKQWLSEGKTRVRLANFVAANKNKGLLGLYEVELKQGIRQLSDSFDVLYQVVVCTISSDLLPGNNGCSYLQPQLLVLTTSHIILCQESFISGPALRFTQAKHTFPPLIITRMLPIGNLQLVTVCDTPQPVSSLDDPMYQICISSSFGPWNLCCHSLDYFDKFLSSLRRHWDSIYSSKQELKITRSTKPMSSFPSARNQLSVVIQESQSRGGKPHGKNSPPLFIKSVPMLQFAALPHWAKMQTFKDHIAQGDFMKSDETLLSVFLAHSQPPLEKRVEVEVYVIASNYAIYFLSDTDGIKMWLDAGGHSSFARMSLLSGQTDTQLQCFYRLWLADLTHVRIGPLLLSFRLHDSKSNSYIDILTHDIQSTSSFMSALASTVGFKEILKEKEVENILEEFVDVADDPFGENTPLNPPAPIYFAKRSIVELMLPNDLQLADMKLHLIESHPDVAKGSSITKCSESIQILFPSIMLLTEHVRVRDSLLLHYRPHLLLLTNFGIFVCGNSLNPDITPSLLTLSSSQLVVKRWVHINDVQRVQVAEDSTWHVPQLLVYTRATQDTSGLTHLCVIPCSKTQADTFVTFLSMMWEERMGKPLLIQYLD